MPAYNAGAYIDEAISSILKQTFHDFEFIIINDGSSDDTASILQRYEQSDGRIRVLHQENQGMIAALNRGCRLAHGEYIARMDADDISYAHRLEKQLEYIERHPQIGILGTWICKLAENGRMIGTWCPPPNPKVLKWTHFFGVCVAHPSVLMRRRILEELGFYRNHAVHTEDVDLWLRASAITEFGNVPELLLKYRVWEGSVSQNRRQSARESHVQLLASFIKQFLKVEPPIEAVTGLRQTRVGPPFEDLRQIRLTAALIQKLHKKFVRENVLTLNERREISWDAAKRVASLALQASRFSRLGSIPIVVRALKLDYRLLGTSAVMKGVGRVMQQPGFSPTIK
jgi:hypothetical protein